LYYEAFWKMQDNGYWILVRALQFFRTFYLFV